MKNPSNIKIPVVYLGVLLVLTLAIQPALAGGITEVEPNNSIADAQNIDADFSIGANPDIEDAETNPWVSIAGTGDGTFDYYSFEVPAAGVIGTFDIDFGSGGDGSADYEIFLYAADGTFLDENDDNGTTNGAGGSTSGLDSYLQHTFSAPGTYVIAVGEFSSFNTGSSVGGNTPDVGDTYELQVSLTDHVIDSDGDGIADDVDCNPNSNLNETVVFGTCDSGVANTLFENGCTVTDLVSACADDALNHGNFVSCVSEVTNGLKQSGDISGRDKGMIQSCAAESDIAK